MKKTILTIALTMVMCFAIVGTTFAWLVAKTDTITNTFTIGDINITLTETTGTSYKTIPGATVAKDPTVTVKKDSEACYLFVKIVEENNTVNDKKVINYTVNSAWTQVTGVAGVYYIALNTATSEDTTYQVLAGNDAHTTGIVTISDGITKNDLATITANNPSLKITAYAVQAEGFANAATAWAEAQKLG